MNYTRQTIPFSTFIWNILKCTQILKGLVQNLFINVMLIYSFKVKCNSNDTSWLIILILMWCLYFSKSISSVSWEWEWIMVSNLDIPESLDSGRKSWTLDSGRWTLNSGRWTLDAGLWTLDFGRWTLHLGSYVLGTRRCCRLVQNKIRTQFLILLIL